jgi:hypothetical protein
MDIIVTSKMLSTYLIDNSKTGIDDFSQAYGHSEYNYSDLLKNQENKLQERIKKLEDKK